jgi:hypothetical protein
MPTQKNLSYYNEHPAAIKGVFHQSIHRSFGHCEFTSGGLGLSSTARKYPDARPGKAARGNKEDNENEAQDMRQHGRAAALAFAPLG